MIIYRPGTHFSFINSLHAKFFRGNINVSLHFMSFLHTDVPEIVEEVLPRIKDQDFPILHSQYHGC